MATLRGTRTEKNVLAAFAGESQARNRYTFFAKKAREEKFLKIAAIFEETAMNEMEHAQRFFRFLEGGDVEVSATFPAGVIGSTKENLQAAAAGENCEHTVLYPQAAEIAKEEGFAEIAAAFRAIALVEKEHEARYLRLLEQVAKGTVLKREKPIRWKCSKCGYIHVGKTPPQRCPACGHEEEYYEPMEEC